MTFFVAANSNELKGWKITDNIENPTYLINFLFIISTKIIYYIVHMNTIFLLFLTIYIGYYLFRPITKKEVEKFQDLNNWSNMGF